MKIKCRYCDSMISDTCEKCPNCGAANIDMLRDGSSKPQTIEELKGFCESKNMPLEKMRFFIGKDCKEPKCFGIYEKNDHFIVYKNKSDGTRAVRYEGYDEAYAVAQIYDKLKEEVDNRCKVSNATIKAYETPKISEVKTKSGSIIRIIIAIVILTFTISGLLKSIDKIITNDFIDWKINWEDNSDNYYPGYSHSYPIYNYYPSYSYGYDNDYTYDYNDSYNHNDSYNYNYDSSYTYDDSYSYDWNTDWDYNSSWDNDNSWDYDYDSWNSWDSDWDSNW